MKRSNKPLPKVDIISYGRYTGWNKDEKELPELLDLSDKIKAEVDIEFGMIVRIWKAKGRYLQYRIEHPPFTDTEGNIMPDFTGEYQIRTNPADFFLGDTVWEPVEDKKGDWKLSIYFDEIPVVEKVITIV